jgi:glucose/arabinose dehydrogenase
MRAEPFDSQVWGRPVGLAVAKDGSLIVTEDGNGTLWSVAYRGDARTASDGGEIARHFGN